MVEPYVVKARHIFARPVPAATFRPGQHVERLPPLRVHLAGRRRGGKKKGRRRKEEGRKPRWLHGCRGEWTEGRLAYNRTGGHHNKRPRPLSPFLCGPFPDSSYLVEELEKQKGAGDGTGGAVLVDHGWKPEDDEAQGPLVVDEELVHRAPKGVHGLLHAPGPKQKKERRHMERTRRGGTHRRRDITPDTAPQAHHPGQHPGNTTHIRA